MELRTDGYRIRNALLHFKLRDDSMLDAEHKLKVLLANVENMLPLILHLTRQVAGSAPAGLDERPSIADTGKQIGDALRDLLRMSRGVAASAFAGPDERDALADAAKQLLSVVRALQKHQRRVTRPGRRRDGSK